MSDQLITTNNEKFNLKRFIISLIIAPVYWVWSLGYKIVEWFKREKWYAVGLVVVVIFFILLRLPHLDNDFSWKHVQKYASSVEPVKHMLVNNNPFLIQRKYMSDPVNNPDGLFKVVANLPTLEWYLYLVNKILPFNSIERNTRIATLIVGIFLLIFIYLVIAKISNKITAIISVFLLPNNYLFNLLTYETTYDLLSYLILFISIYILLNNKNFGKNILFSGLISGVFAGTKYSYIIFIAPIAFFIIFFVYKENLHKKIIYFIGFVVFMMLAPVINVLCSINKIELLNKTLLLIFIYLLFIISFKYIRILALTLYKFIYKINFSHLFIAMTVGMSFFMYLLVFRFKLVSPELFLSDSSILFNWNMYNKIANWFNSYYFINGYFLLILFFLIYTPLIKLNKTITIITSGFILSSVLYLIFGAKVIFFHQYYLLLFIFTYLFISSCILYGISKIINHKLLILIVLPFMLLSYSFNQKQYDKIFAKTNTNLIQVSEYINSNFNNDEKVFISYHEASILSYYTNLPTFSYQMLIRNKEIIINNNDFFKDYNINYHIVYKEINYYHLGLIYNEDKRVINRSDAIVKRLGISDIYKKDDIVNIGKSKFENRLILEKVIGDYLVYRIN